MMEKNPEGLFLGLALIILPVPIYAVLRLLAQAVRKLQVFLRQRDADFFNLCGLIGIFLVAVVLTFQVASKGGTLPLLVYVGAFGLLILTLASIFPIFKPRKRG